MLTVYPLLICWMLSTDLVASKQQFQRFGAFASKRNIKSSSLPKFGQQQQQKQQLYGSRRINPLAKAKVKQQQDSTIAKIDKPSLSKIDKPSLAKIDKPALAKIGRPSLAKLDRPSLAKIDRPSSAKIGEQQQAQDCKCCNEVLLEIQKLRELIQENNKLLGGPADPLVTHDQAAEDDLSSVLVNPSQTWSTSLSTFTYLTSVPTEIHSLIPIRYLNKEILFTSTVSEIVESIATTIITSKVLVDVKSTEVPQAEIEKIRPTKTLEKREATSTDETQNQDTSLNFKTDAAGNNTPVEDIPPHLNLKSSIMKDGAEQDIETTSEEL